MNRRRILGLCLAGLTALAAATLVVRGGASAGNDEGDSDDSRAGTSLARVEQRTLAAQVQVSGTLGFGGNLTVVNQANGTITELPSVGDIVKQGEVLYRVNGRPVVLLYGHTAAWRELAAGSSASDVTGADVQQLNAALVALGFADEGLDPQSDQFSWRTTNAVNALQEALGLDDTGALGLGDVVFLPTPLRVTTTPVSQGQPAQPGVVVLEGTSTDPVVTVDLDTARQNQVHEGDPVEVTLPDLSVVPATVTSVSTVAGSAEGGGAGEPSVRVEVTLDDPIGAGGLDQAPVLVSITTATVENVLAVPVTALLALAGGGYAVEVDDGDGSRRLVPVEVGLFDDREGLLEVTSTDLDAGQRVVVPGT